MLHLPHYAVFFEHTLTIVAENDGKNRVANYRVVGGKITIANRARQIYIERDV